MGSNQTSAHILVTNLDNDMVISTSRAPHSDKLQCIVNGFSYYKESLEWYKDDEKIEVSDGRKITVSHVLIYCKSFFVL